MSMREQLAAAGYINLGAIFENLAPALLVEQALSRGEGRMASTGALAVETGK